ncbi:protein of unknown function [Cyanobium sp. NIES-981]|nr:hypothetical protein [Cyanobium sp. NIES-981]SBO44283.1 protein of unknown function [Cyanobium sp. NIES-981]
MPLEQLLLASFMQTWTSRASLERIDGPDNLPPPPSGPGEGGGSPNQGKKPANVDGRCIMLSN